MDDDELVGVVRPLRVGIELRRLPVSRPSCVSNGGMRREAVNGGMQDNNKWQQWSTKLSYCLKRPCTIRSRISDCMIVSHVQSRRQDLQAHRRRSDAYLIVGESPFPVAASTSSRSAETFPFFLMILD